MNYEPSTQAKKTFVFPVSPAQRGLWFLHQLAPEDFAYNVPFAARIEGPLNVSALERSLQEIINRHESLRTRFQEADGEPHQIIEDPVTVELSQLDLKDLPEKECSSRLQRRMEEDARRPFDLRQTPMLRPTLFKCSEQVHVLLLNMHHISTDHWSRWVLFEELSALYEAFSSGKVSPLPELPIQYADFTIWQRDRLNDLALQRHLAYWKTQLQGVTPLDLATDRPRSANVTNRGKRVTFDLPLETSVGLRQLCRQQGTTLYATLLTAFQALLYRYTGQEDISIGSPIAGRTRPEMEPLIGLFINTLVMRAKLSGELPFAEALRRTKEITLDAYEHQELPFEKVVEALCPMRDPNQTPLFQVMFNLQNAPPPVLHLGAAKLERVPLHCGRVLYDLLWEMEESGTHLRGAVEYKTDLFDDSTIDRMIRHYRNLVAGIVADPQRSIASLPLMDKMERIEILQGFHRQLKPTHVSHISSDGGTTLHELFEAQVARRPEAVALKCGEESLTYAQLNARANRVARSLVQCGIKPDTLVGLCLERSNELVISLLAILKAGGAYLPIDLAYPADRLAFMLDDAQAPVLLTQSKLVGKLPPTNAKVLYVDELLAKAPHVGEEENLDASIGPDALAYVIYTSGTTGKPKGSLITHRNVVRLFPATDDWYRFNAQDVWTLFHSTAFDFSVWEMWGAFLYGGRLVVVPYMVSRSPESFYDLIVDEQVTVLNQTPSAFRQLIQAEESIGPKKLALRYVIFGGEALDIGSLRSWFERHGDDVPKLVNMYGITETTVHVTYRPLSNADLDAGSLIGTPIPDLQIYILDPQREPTPIGVPGEIYVGGAGLARGYLRRPELTAERFIPDHLGSLPGSRLYRTGDRARFLQGGDIEYLGRMDQQVKIRGFRIELGEIESVLRQDPILREAVVAVREDQPGQKILAAYLVANQEATDTSRLRENLKKSLPDYMVPSAFIFLDKMPLTASGKVDYRALPIPDPQRLESRAKRIPPATDAENIIATVWQQLLRLQEVGIEENFFDLGGTSLLIVQAHRRLREIFTADLSVITLFEYPTIRSLAQRLTQPALSAAKSGNERKDRAERQRQAFQRSRPVSRTT